MIKSVLGYILGWILVGCAVVFLIDDDRIYRPLWIVALLGIPTGLLSAYFEMRFIPDVVGRIGIAQRLILRTMFYTILVAIMVTIYIALSIKFGLQGGSLAEVFRSDAFLERITGRRFYISIALYVTLSAAINFARQIRRILGPGKTTKLFLGRYETPRKEDRLFMFLDLKESVNLSESLGPIRFNQFKNDFFGDIVEPILETEGEIYQYVGDEVVITWPLEKGIEDGNFIRCYWDIDEIVRNQKERYLRRYGMVPEFRAGVAGGEVVTAEIGDLKRDLVHSGDPVNVAARLEGKAKALGKELLAESKLLHNRNVLSQEFEIEVMDNVDLKGVASATQLVSIIPKSKAS